MKTSLSNRLAKLEEKHSPAAVVFYFQDLDNPDLYREEPGQDGPTHTKAELEAANQGTDNIVFWVEYHRESV